MSAAADTTGVQTLTVTLNGQEVQARPGQTILEVAQEAGVEIPTLCHDPRLEPYGACRMCLVEVEGARGPMAACGTAVTNGMKIQTHTEKIRKIRKFVLELLLTNHPLDCPVCEAAGDCRLQDYAYEYLVDMVPWGWRPPVVGDPGPHPNVAHFGARCILCGRCVRICREVMSIGCWGYLNRGYDSEVDTPYRLPLQDVDCVSCGQCVSTCPVGAIVEQRTPQGARAWQTEKTVTTCSYCADGCRLVMHTFRGRVVKVTSETGRGLNNGNLCIKGRFGQGYADSPDRLATPLVRNAKGELEEASWADALARVKDRMGKIISDKGGASVAAICGTNLTNEAAYLVQKLMRTVVGSHSVDSIDHAEQAASERALRAALGLAATTNSRKDLGQADVIVVVGANLTASDPVLALDVIKAIRSNKTVIVIDPRTTELAAKAKYHLAVIPGTDLAALRGIMRHLLDLGLEDAAFIGERTEGFEALRESLAGVDVEAEAAVCGIESDTLRAAAAAYGRAAAAAIMYGPGATHGPLGGDVAAALVDLALMTGNLGRPGTGLYPLRSGANSQGLADMGVRPDLLPGGLELTDAEAVARVEAAWGASLGGLAPGLTVDEMVAGIENGDITALYVVGADPVLALPDDQRLRAAMQRLDFLVVEDGFLSDTAQYADVVLPASVAGEDDGTFTNCERFVQRVRAAAPCYAESKPDWKILQAVANTLGGDWAYAAPGDVMREITEVVPAYQGVSYDGLDEAGIQWPCLATGGEGTPLLYSGGFPRGKAAFAPVVQGVATVDVCRESCFVLLTGTVREHHATGVRTRRAPGITRLVQHAYLEMNPKDAANLGVDSDAKVRVTASGSGASLEVPVCVTSRVPAGVVFYPGFSPSAPVTRLLNAEDRVAVAVKVERLA
jgi:predicted molibdopterin-dependent oxidoreductase YjgC